MNDKMPTFLIHTEYPMPMEITAFGDTKRVYLQREKPIVRMEINGKTIEMKDSSPAEIQRALLEGITVK